MHRRIWNTAGVTIEKEQAEINAYKDEIAALKAAHELQKKQERIDERKEKTPERCQR